MTSRLSLGRDGELAAREQLLEPPSPFGRSLQASNMYIYIYIHTYIHTYIHMYYMYVYVYIYIYI